MTCLDSIVGGDAGYCASCEFVPSVTHHFPLSRRSESFSSRHFDVFLVGDFVALLDAFVTLIALFSFVCVRERKDECVISG